MANTNQLPIHQISTAIQRGYPAEAERLTREFLAHAPNDENGLLLLGLSLQHQGRSTEAELPYRRLTVLFPQSALHWTNLGSVLRSAGKGGEAVEAFQRAIELDPNYYGSRVNLGYLYMERGMYPRAREQFMRAHSLAPEEPEARIFAAQMCFALDSRELAEELVAPWRQWTDLSEDLALELAILMMNFGKTEDSSRLFEDLLRDNPRNHRAVAHLAVMFERVNRLDEAREMLARLPAPETIYDPALLAETNSARATLALREKDPAAARALLEGMISARNNAASSNPGNDGLERENLFFPLATACDRVGDADAAMAALAKAHALQLELARQLLPELLEPDSQPLQTATKWVDAASYASWPQLPAPETQDSPIFIVGFPRSGTTMLEQMLDAHSSLQAMDERAFLQDLIEHMSRFGYVYPYDLGKLTEQQCNELRDLYFARTAKVAPRSEGQRLVDKNPLNMLRLPLIKRLFPNAQIVLALRHPCDILLSNYMQHFRSNAFAILCSSLERLAKGYVTAFEFWQHHADLMKPNVIVSRYEDLLDDFPGNVKRIGDFLGLEDAAPLARFDEHARDKGFISTPSYTRVIEPPNKKAVGRWRRYEKYFTPVLPRLRPLMERFGYDA